MSCKYCRRDAMKRRKLPSSPLRPLTGDQAATLMASLENENADQELKDAVTLVLNTGMRLGELRDLRWKDVNFRERNITFYGSTLSRYVRRIPFNTAVAEMLERRHGSSPSSESVFKAASTDYFSREFRQLKELGQRFLGRAVTFHDLRHTFFAQLVNNGADLATLMSIGGWHSTLTPASFMSPRPPAHVLAGYDAAKKKEEG